MAKYVTKILARPRLDKVCQLPAAFEKAKAAVNELCAAASGVVCARDLDALYRLNCDLILDGDRARFLTGRYDIPHQKKKA